MTVPFVPTQSASLPVLGAVGAEVSEHDVALRVAGVTYSSSGLTLQVTAHRATASERVVGLGKVEPGQPGPVWGRILWDSEGHQYADTSIPLKDAMAKNPYMKIFIACGYYDMATPFYAAEYTVSSLNLEPELRRNISFDYYEAGHMMYIEKNSLKKLHDDAAAFIDAAVRR